MNLFPLVGSITMWPHDSTPDGYLRADGAAVSRATYPALFAAYGVKFGAGDGSTTFNLPDLRGRFPRFPDYSAGIDGDVGSRTPPNVGVAGVTGSTQSSNVRSHFHNYTNYLFTLFNPARPATGNTLNPAESYISDASFGSTEFRPINKTIAGLVKY